MFKKSPLSFFFFFFFFLACVKMVCLSLSGCLSNVCMYWYSFFFRAHTIKCRFFSSVQTMKYLLFSNVVYYCINLLFSLHTRRQVRREDIPGDSSHNQHTRVEESFFYILSIFIWWYYICLNSDYSSVLTWHFSSLHFSSKHHSYFHRDELCNELGIHTRCYQIILKPHPQNL